MKTPHDREHYDTYGEISADDFAKKVEENYKYYANLRRNRKVLFVLTCTLLGSALLTLLLLITPSNSAEVYRLSESLRAIGNSSVFLGAALAALIAGFTAGFFKYLQPKNLSSKKISTGNNNLKGALSSHERKIATLDRKFDTIIEKLQSGTISGELFSKEEKAEILNDLLTKLEQENFDSLYKNISKKIIDGKKYKDREELFTRTTSRLELEINSQTRRGNMNLLLGILTTILGVSVLGYSVLTAPAASSGFDAGVHFLPRLSLVIVIEVFAYFFLRLYKQSLDEIKYFQNEMTNIESKYLGLHMAAELDTENAISEVISNLSCTERNFILEKGQTTTQLEKLKIEASNNSSLKDLLAPALSRAINIQNKKEHD